MTHKSHVGKGRQTFTLRKAFAAWDDLFMTSNEVRNILAVETNTARYEFYRRLFNVLVAAGK